MQHQTPRQSPQSLPLQSWVLLGSLYTTQFLGLGFFVVALVAILREGGAALETVGLVYLLGMVWPFKFLWAPLVDRFALLRSGHYRGWLLVMQGLLVVVLSLIGLFDVRTEFGTIYVLCLVVSCLSATQDIAVDGLACRLLGPDERGVGNGLQIAGGLLGNLIGGGVMLMAYPYIGWQGCMISLAAGTAVSLGQLVLFREPDWGPRRPTTGALFARMVTFWRMPGQGRWILLLVFLPISSSMCYAVVVPSLVDAGWDLAGIGLVVNVAGSLAGLAAALATGWFASRLGRRSLLVAAALIQLVGVAGMIAPILLQAGAAASAASAILFFVCYNPGAAILATMMMDHAAPESAATDYTLQYSLSQLAGMTAMFGTAMIAASLGYAGALAVAGLVALFAAWLATGYRSGVSAKPNMSGAPALLP
ncbi:MFS transporter [Xanthobacteraceae bacterium A53D]